MPLEMLQGQRPAPSSRATASSPSSWGPGPSRAICLLPAGTLSASRTTAVNLGERTLGEQKNESEISPLGPPLAYPSSPASGPIYLPVQPPSGVQAKLATCPRLSASLTR